MVDSGSSSPLVPPALMPDLGEIDLEAGPGEQFQCRICLETDGRDFIAPCKCKGTSKYVHRECLDHWRSVKEGFAFAHCTTCKAPYYLRVHVHADRKWRTLKFRFFVTRDILFIFVAVQLVISSLAYLVYLTDSYQQYWLRLAWGFDSKLSFYYICGALMFFALLGLSGCFITCYDRRVRNDLAQPCRELCLCCCHPGWKERLKKMEEDLAYGIPFVKNFQIADNSSGEPGAGSYYHYKEDVQLLADIGLKAYRFSISWSRVLPKGRGDPNEEGILYYNLLIDELLQKGIKPYITLFHWDVPQALEDEYGGFLSSRILEDYKNYVNLCFQRFGDRVKHWITMNEPYMFCSLGYCYGIHAPGHCTPDLEIEGNNRFLCPQGDSLREPYKVAHNILLAHAEAVHLYKENYKAKFGGEVGITLVSHWYEPYDNRHFNKEAQQRALDFMLGWFLEPLKFGDYPFSMRALVRERLPIFTAEESAKLRDSFDFIGLNYYTSRYARDKPNYNYTNLPKTCGDDLHVDVLVAKENVPIGPAEKNSWVNVYPKGLKKLLLHIKEKYSNPPIYITENGVLEYKNKDRENSVQEDKRTELPSPIHDIFRMEYHTSHLHELEDALSSRANVKGYFVWSLVDSFEWQDGYTCRFGLNHIDYTNLDKPTLKRHPKQSAVWLHRFLKNIYKDPPTPPYIPAPPPPAPVLEPRTPAVELPAQILNSIIRSN